MKFLYGLGGANVPVIKEFELNYNTQVIEYGSFVGINSDGKAGRGPDYQSLGIAAEPHGTKPDILNPRFNGSTIRVDVTKNAVYSAPAPRIVAKSGTGTTVVTANYDMSSTMVGSTLVLVKKGENSENTDEIGTQRKITAFTAGGSDCTITIAAGGTICEGDVYAIMPPFGYESAASDDYETISFGVGSGGKLRVVGQDFENYSLEVIFLETIYD